jgi:hypothetical protein
MIGVNDVVWVAKWPCCGHNLGFTGTVINIRAHNGTLTCSHCKAKYPARSELLVNIDNRIVAAMPWLRKIPPLGELEGQRTQEPIREPALVPQAK